LDGFLDLLSDRAFPNDSQRAVGLEYEIVDHTADGITLRVSADIDPLATDKHAHRIGTAVPRVPQPGALIGMSGAENPACDTRRTPLGAGRHETLGEATEPGGQLRDPPSDWTTR